MLRLWIVTALSMLASATAAFDSADLARIKATGTCRGRDLSGADLHGLDLAGADLKGLICQERLWIPPISAARHSAVPISPEPQDPSLSSPGQISAAPVRWRSMPATTKTSPA